MIFAALFFSSEPFTYCVNTYGHCFIPFITLSQSLSICGLIHPSQVLGMEVLSSEPLLLLCYKSWIISYDRKYLSHDFAFPDSKTDQKQNRSKTKRKSNFIISAFYKQWKAYFLPINQNLLIIIYFLEMKFSSLTIRATFWIYS